MRRGKRVTHMRKGEIHKDFWLGNLKGEEHFEELVAKGIISLKMIFQKYFMRFRQ